MLLLTVVGCVSREQQRSIENLVEENRVFKEQLGSEWLRLTNHQRRRLAERRKRQARRLLGCVATIGRPNPDLHRSALLPGMGAREDS